MERHTVIALLRAPIAILLLALPISACDAGREATTGGTAPGASTARPLPEQVRLDEIVADTRAILPRIPTGAQPPPATEVSGDVAPARLVLIGEGRLLRPSTFPRLPGRIRVELFLDDREPPGGYLRISGGQGGAQRWPLLSGYGAGSRDASFRYGFRVGDPLARLRYFSLLGVRHETGGKSYRSFEGYLIYPTKEGKLSTQGAIYPIDFGYRHPEPPLAVQAARGLSSRIAALQALQAQQEVLRKRRSELEQASTRLKNAQVPAGQAQKRRSDLQEYARQIAALGTGIEKAGRDMRTALKAAYTERAAAAAAWETFAGENAYRWRSTAQKRSAYLPLQKLRASYPALEKIYAALDGDRQPALRAARAAMERAVLRESEFAPTAKR